MGPGFPPGLLYGYNRLPGRADSNRTNTYEFEESAIRTHTQTAHSSLNLLLWAAFFDLDCAEVDACTTIYRGAGWNVL